MNLKTLGRKLPCKLRAVNLIEDSPKINDSLAGDVLAKVVLYVRNVQMIHNSLNSASVAIALTLKSSKGLDGKSLPQNILLKLDKLRPEKRTVTNRQPEAALTTYPRLYSNARSIIPVAHLWDKLVEVSHGLVPYQAICVHGSGDIATFSKGCL
jgi:hypothetical protein